MSCVGLWTASKVEQLVEVMWKGTWESWRSQLYSCQKVVETQLPWARGECLKPSAWANLSLNMGTAMVQA